jgi:parallel beta-helix repeat protein
MLVLLVISTLALAFEIQPVWANGTIYIYADGSIIPSTAPILTVDNITYTFTGNISQSIVVQRNNTIIDGAGYTVKGSGTGTGIDLESVNNVTIKNTNITGFSSGIWLNSSSSNTLLDNGITGNGLYGIGLNYSSSNTMSDNSASGNGVGIYLYYSSNNTLSGNKATGNYKGIVLDSSSNNTLRDNKAVGNPACGIVLYSSSYNTLSEDNATGNSGLGGVGIYFSSSSYNTLSGSIATENYYGIFLDSSPSNVLFQNVIDNSVWSNFGVYGSTLSDYINWVDASNLADGKPVYYYVNQDGLAIRPATHPSIGYLALINCTNITVENLTLANKNKESLLLAYTTNSTITQNNISNKEYGIYLYSSSNNTVSNNNVTPSAKYTLWGIYVDSSSNNTVSNNNVTGNGGGISLSDDSNNKVSGNTVTGNGGGIGLGPSSSNDTLSGNTVTGNTSWGITLGDSSNNTISGNNVTGNSYQGINLYSSFNNTVSSNSITENFGDAIYIFYCSNNTVSGNNVTRNSYGIWFDDSSNNAILGNIATGNSGSGIALGSSTYNRVSENSAIGNGVGILLDNSSSNTIYHNNFINNTQQAALSNSGPNTWDNGYPSGGNYWSNYTGSDSYSAPNQNETGSDGIGDTPYVIDANNTDHYPLVAPITSFNAGTWNGTICNVDILSNSTVSDLQIDIANKTVSFNVTGPESTDGFCRVTIPNVIVQDLWHGNYTVLLNNGQWPFANWTDASNTYIYINYTHSEHEVAIIPEFPSTMTVWLFTLLSTFAVALAKRRTPRKLVT